MCGIAGIFDARTNVDPTVAREMANRLSHRGPDDDGVYLDAGVALAHRRLSILDLSAAGHQPMATPDGRFWITYNGEIYNFWDVREVLEARGYKFSSRTDTETILYAYQEWGPGCLDRFNGIFALAIWDARERTLFAARDRLGVKPFYYAFDGRRLTFGSEIKAMLADPRVRVDLSPKAIVNYFTFGHSVAPDTIFSSVKKLLPGHYLLCREGAGSTLAIDIREYWQPPVPGSHGPAEDLGEDFYVTEVRERLGVAVRRQMLADVPVGVFLSGGIDSSSLAALMCRLGNGPVQSFSVGFSSAAGGYDELADARRVARHLGTQHHELVVEQGDVPSVIDSLVYHYDEPFADAASLPTFLVARLARQHVKVALSGEGSDEVFGGYRRYLAERFAGRAPWLSEIISSPRVQTLLRTGVGSSKAKRLMRGLGVGDPIARYAAWFQVFGPDMRQELLGAGLAGGAGAYDPFDAYRRIYPGNGAGPVDKAMYLDQRTWLPDTYLEKVDKATMAIGLEARVPFLDHELVEFGATIPAKYKIRGLTTKYVLKRAMAPLLPEATLRKKKHGFSVPYPVWFRGPLREFVSDILLGDRARNRGILEPRAVARLIDEHQAGRQTHYRQLWLVLIFEMWCRRYLDGGGGSAARVPEQLGMTA